MFKYTRAAFSLIIKRLNLFSKIFKWSLIIFSFVYFIHAIIFEIGNVIINSSLLVMLVGYTIFEISTRKIENKEMKKTVKRIYSLIKILVRALSLGGTIYGVYTSSTSVSSLTSIVLPLMIILWILQVLIELVSWTIDKYMDCIIEGAKKDLIEMKKVTDIAGFVATGGISTVVKKIKNEEQLSVNDSVIEKLDKEIEIKKQNKIKLKAAKKELRKKRRLENKNKK